MTDTAGISTQQNFNLVVATDTFAPLVTLIANYNQVNIGEKISLLALATDNVKVAVISMTCWVISRRVPAIVISEDLLPYINPPTVLNTMSIGGLRQ